MNPGMIRLSSRHGFSYESFKPFMLLPRLALVALVLQFGVHAADSEAAESALIEKARKHIREKVPKGMTPLKDAEVTLKSKKSIHEVDFTVELECDEPRYVIRDLEIGGDPIPGKVQKKLQLEGFGTKYLFKKYGKGDLKTVQGKFNIRGDGSPGTISAFQPESLGFIREEQPELPVDGDAKFTSAKASAETHLEEIKKAKSEKTSTAVSGFFNGLKNVASTVGNVAGVKNPELKTNIDTATRAFDAVTGQQAVPAAQQPQPVVASQVAQPANPPAAIAQPVAQPVATTAPVAQPTGQPEASPVSIPVSESKSLSGTDVEWLTPEQAAKKLQISESDVLNAIAKGEIKAKKIGPVWRIPAKELQ